MKVKLLPAQIEKLNALPTQNPQAYDLFLKGDYALDRAWKSGEYEKTLKPAIAAFREAIALDPQFALAFAQLANAQLTEYHFGIIDYSAKRMPELLASAKENIDRALRLQPDLPAAHSSLGYWYYWGKSDYETALAEFKRALSADPRLFEASQGMAGIAIRRGHAEQAISYLSNELEADPRNVRLFRFLAICYEMRRDFSRAVVVSSRAVALDPASEVDASNLSQAIIRERGDVAAAMRVLDAVPAELQHTQNLAENRKWLLTLRRDFAAAKKVVEDVPLENWRSEWRRPLLLGDIQRALGQKELAQKSFQEARSLVTAAIAKGSEEPLTHSDLAYADAGLGLIDEALREADRAIELQPAENDAFRGPPWLVDRAEVNAKLGRRDEAIKLLEQMLALPVHAIAAWELKLDPAWDPLRGDPRFQKLVASEEAKEAAASK